ncbi:glycoside hydrolase family 130 protein [Candidatus Auribacterota bacterium]
MGVSRRDILHRWKRNPLITLEDIPYRCNTVFNAAAAKFNNEYLLLLRVESLQGYSVLVMAYSKDGYHFSVENKSCMFPATEEPFKTYEAQGVEDPRIIFLEDTYYIMYTAYSKYGVRIGLAKTLDFKTFERVALVSEPGNKDGMLFPKKIKGQYVRLDRPKGNKVGNIWISYSPDLIHWGNSKVLITIREGHWDSHRIGGSVPPLETSRGWLHIYHGVKKTVSGPIYRLGALLLDIEDPSQVIGRSEIPILTPRENYERIGDINNVVFSCGAILEDDGELKVYYGAADTSICLATAHINEILDSCVC